MSTWTPIIMLAASGFCLGGVISLVRAKMIGFALVMGAATLLCVGAAWTWWV